MFLHFGHVIANHSSIKYQSSLPEGDVDHTRVWQIFRGQMKSHQELCAAKHQKDNLRRRRWRMHRQFTAVTLLQVQLTPTQSTGSYNCPLSHVPVCLHYLISYPKTSGLPLDKTMQRFAGHQLSAVCLLYPMFSCCSHSRCWLSALHCQ